MLTLDQFNYLSSVFTEEYSFTFNSTLWKNKSRWLRVLKDLRNRTSYNLIHWSLMLQLDQFNALLSVYTEEHSFTFSSTLSIKFMWFKLLKDLRNLASYHLKHWWLMLKQDQFNCLSSVYTKEHLFTFNSSS